MTAIKEFFNWYARQLFVEILGLGIKGYLNIRKCLQYAFQIGMIRSNPADRVERPRIVSIFPENTKV